MSNKQSEPHTETPDTATPVHWPANSVPFPGSRRHRPTRIAPDPNRGLMRKLTDALLKLVGYDPYIDPITRKQRD